MAEDRRLPDCGGKPEGTARPPEGSERPARDERARARAYLDLWERRLVELALAGPDPAAPGRRPR